jgi:hypothetical protein
MLPYDHSPNTCFQGSTDFYDTPDTDQFTPSYLEAQPLPDSASRRVDGSKIPWLDPCSDKSAMEQYVEWFNTIWHTGDPSGWNSTIFTNQAVMIDPSGISKGAKQAAEQFLLLFRYFPELRGEVVSWAANEREIFINWRFRILPRGSKTPILVSVVDKFCFADGRVSFRLANFDIITLTGYLSKYFGQDQLYDFLQATFLNAEKTGGIQSLPQMLGNLLLGLFLWPAPPPPTGLIAEPGNGVVRLRWDPIPEAIEYTICRASSYAGPYNPVGTVKVTSCDPATSYDDREVVNGTAYWYSVSPVFKPWKPLPPKANAPFITHARRQTAQTNIFGGYSAGR